MQAETWEQTSLAMAVENDYLKHEIIALVMSMPKGVLRYEPRIRSALSGCGFSTKEIDMYLTGELDLGEYNG